MKTPWVSIALLGLLVAIGCSSGPPLIKPGSPAFFWAVAKESYRTGDLLKTDATLVELGQGDSEFAAPARVWQMVVAAGLTQGFSELADVYDAGSGQGGANAVRFHRHASTLRSAAATAALEFTQAVHNFRSSDQNATVLLAFPFPPGSAALPEGLTPIHRGTWPPDSDRELLQAAMLQRGVLLAVSQAVGAAGDPVKAMAAFVSTEVRIPREPFLVNMAKLLYQESSLFGVKQMDRPDRVFLMNKEAFDLLASIPLTDETTALAAEIQATLKQNSGI